MVDRILADTTILLCIQMVISGLLSVAPGSLASSSSSSLVSLDTDEELTRLRYDALVYHYITLLVYYCYSEGEDFTLCFELADTMAPLKEGQ